MTDKKEKPKGIPLSDLLRDKDGIRRALEFTGENHSDPKLRRALAHEITPLASKGVRFPSGRSAGSKGEKVKHIHKLVRENPGLSAKRLYAIADKTVIGEMEERTFDNHVSNARKSLKNTKPDE